MKIYYTKNYSKFRKMVGNRPVGSTASLEKSMKEHGFIESFPIVVNNKFEIADGQHRLEAAKKVGCGVYYVIDNLMHLDKVIETNSSRKSWKLTDYVTSYASKGNANYINVLELIDNNEDISAKVILIFASGGAGFYQNTGVETRIRNGEFKFIKTYEECEKFCEELRFFCKYFGKKYRQIASALYFILYQEKVPYEKLKESFTKYGNAPENKIDGVASVSHALLQFEKIYNTNRKRNRANFVLDHEIFLKKGGEKL